MNTRYESKISISLLCYRHKPPFRLALDRTNRKFGDKYIKKWTGLKNYSQNSSYAEFVEARLFLNGLNFFIKNSAFVIFFGYIVFLFLIRF